MKKTFYFSLVILACIIITAMVNPNNNESNVKAPLMSGYMPENSFPDSVMKIFERSCFDCHSDKSGNFTAKGKVNFTNWDEYTPAKKVGKMDDICNIITKGKMPKKSYVSKNPEKALTKAEIDLICKWTAEESKKLVGE